MERVIVFRLEVGEDSLSMVMKCVQESYFSIFLIETKPEMKAQKEAVSEREGKSVTTYCKKVHLKLSAWNLHVQFCMYCIYWILS